MSSESTERIGRSAGFRLGWWYALVFSAGAVALVGITYLLLAASLRQYDREIIQTTLVQFATAYARGGVDGLTREIQRVQSSGAAGPLLVRTLGRRQDVVYLSVPDGWGRFDLSQLATPALTGEQEWATVHAGADSDETLEVASIRFADGTLFQVGKSTERRSELLRRFRRVLLLNLTLILFIGLAGGAVLTRSALEPVRSLAATVRGILRTGQTSARVPVPREADDALSELSVLVNAMLDRIDAVVSGMRGALDNVGHDLRTPMARLRGTAEGALASNDPAALREALGACVEESEEIMAMLNTLMDISEAETGTMALRLESVSLEELVDQAIDLYEDLAEHQGIRLASSVAENVAVEVDRIRMRQALANLVDNALKYTGAGGEVVVTAAPDGATHVVISVTDTGMGIPPEELPHIWNRLYRGDKSRASRGLGLGLSLVKAIVEAHGGQTSVTSTVGAGSRFDVRLPRRANLSRL